MSKIIGIDISKQTFDVCFRKKDALTHQVYENNQKGFKKLMCIIDSDSIVVMEASGPYYVCLAHYLYEHSINVSVINPLIIKRFSQMRFYRTKTDKKDAEVIMEYGFLEADKLSYWKPESGGVKSLKQMQTTIELLYKQLGQRTKQKSTIWI